MPVILTLGKMRQQDCYEFKARLGPILSLMTGWATGEPGSKAKTKNTKKQRQLSNLPCLGIHHKPLILRHELGEGMFRAQAECEQTSLAGCLSLRMDSLSRQDLTQWLTLTSAMMPP